MDLEEKIEEMEKNIISIGSMLHDKNEVDKHKIKNLKIIIYCITFILSLSIIGNIYCVYELSQYEKVTERNVTETYDIEQQTDGDSEINNIKGNQYNDNATHNENKGSK